MSPVLLGNRMVLDSLARCEKAETYCSATLSDAAAFPFCGRQQKAVQRRRGCGSVLSSSSSPGGTEPPTGPGSPSIWPPLWPRRPGPHLGDAAAQRPPLNGSPRQACRTQHANRDENPPRAWLIRSAFSPSEARIWACLRPSATLMAASLVPSDSSTVALFLRSASTCPAQQNPFELVLQAPLALLDSPASAWTL